jgi:hypothetical protein
MFGKKIGRGLARLRYWPRGKVDGAVLETGAAPLCVKGGQP